MGALAVKQDRTCEEHTGLPLVDERRHFRAEREGSCEMTAGSPDIRARLWPGGNMKLLFRTLAVTALTFGASALALAQPYYSPPYVAPSPPPGTYPYGSPLPGQVPAPPPNDYRAAVISQAQGYEDGTVIAIGEARLIIQARGNTRLDPFQGMGRSVPVFAGNSLASHRALTEGTPVRVYYRQGEGEKRYVVGVDLLSPPAPSYHHEHGELEHE